MSPKIAQSIYFFGTIVSAIIGVALLWGGIDSNTADSVNQIISGVGVLIGGGVPSATAAARVTKQKKDGVFDPPPPSAAPADLVVENMPVVVKEVADKVAELERVRKAAGDVLGPVVESLAQQAINSVLR